VKITSKDTVVARNPTTGEVILIAHVQVASMKALRKNMKTVRSNGTMYIGQIGGKGGVNLEGKGIHSHLTFFPSESSRITAVAYKKSEGPIGEYDSSISKHLSDFRNFVKK
jgi:hypothetical protein